MRLIDADALLEGLTLWYENIDTINSPTDVIVHNVLSSVMDDINDCETIDAEPVVHGRWVNPRMNKYGHPCHHCSECGFLASQKDRNYCPNCGAKMEGCAINGRSD